MSSFSGGGFFGHSHSSGHRGMHWGHSHSSGHGMMGGFLGGSHSGRHRGRYVPGGHYRPVRRSRRGGGCLGAFLVGAALAGGSVAGLISLLG